MAGDTEFRFLPPCGQVLGSECYLLLSHVLFGEENQAENHPRGGNLLFLCWTLRGSGYIPRASRKNRRLEWFTRQRTLDFDHRSWWDDHAPLSQKIVWIDVFFHWSLRCDYVHFEDSGKHAIKYSFIAIEKDVSYSGDVGCEFKNWHRCWICYTVTENRSLFVWKYFSSSYFIFVGLIVFPKK